MIASYRHLPAEAADRIATIIERQARGNPDGRVGWSEEWSEEDLLDLNRATLDLVEEEERGAQP